MGICLANNLWLGCVSNWRIYSSYSYTYCPWTNFHPFTDMAWQSSVPTGSGGPPSSGSDDCRTFLNLRSANFKNSEIQIVLSELHKDSLGLRRTRSQVVTCSATNVNLVRYRQQPALLSVSERAQGPYDPNGDSMYMSTRCSNLCNVRSDWHHVIISTWSNHLVWFHIKTPVRFIRLSIKQSMFGVDHLDIQPVWGQSFQKQLWTCYGNRCQWWGQIGTTKVNTNKWQKTTETTMCQKL